ncbi:hemoglobin subunit alpha-D-like [Elgaria multicarinata webbii]|uniref:hemoglobin subunit alpha-D-like n=1 Tax=Elgaria multicarinata webbii TaxID=159646 RepID=UPI002FCCDE74
MVLSAEDCKLLQSTWAKLAPFTDDIGADSLNRLFRVFPKTKVYFSHLDLTPGSSDIRAHGHKVMKALESALKHLDDVHGTLAELGDKHAYNLRVDPVNFKLLAKCFHVVLATHLKAEYTAPVYRAWDKFFFLVADVLTEHYR